MVKNVTNLVSGGWWGTQRSLCGEQLHFLSRKKKNNGRYCTLGPAMQFFDNLAIHKKKSWRERESPVIFHLGIACQMTRTASKVTVDLNCLY